MALVCWKVSLSKSSPTSSSSPCCPIWQIQQQAQCAVLHVQCLPLWQLQNLSPSLPHNPILPCFLHPSPPSRFLF
jgi:hypothetical protein